MPDIFKKISQFGVVPVIAIERVEDSLPLADALLEGGLSVAEITFRTDAAALVIEELSKKRPELIVGAGTILDTISLQKAIDAGAQFGLAPGYDQKIVEAATLANFPFAPGIMTPSDLSLASATPLKTFKFFPAGAAGGPAMLNAISQPFAHLNYQFIPTGGIKLATMAEWFSLPQVVAVGGTWIATREDIIAGNFDKIKQNSAQALSAIKQQHM